MLKKFIILNICCMLIAMGSAFAMEGTSNQEMQAPHQKMMHDQRALNAKHNAMMERKKMHHLKHQKMEQHMEHHNMPKMQQPAAPAAQ